MQAHIALHDEINRLRAENAAYLSELKDYGQSMEKANREIATLKQTIAVLRDALKYGEDR